jgi:hypothetical protein
MHSRLACVAALLVVGLCAAPALVFADGVGCVRKRCEGSGKSCVATTYDVFNACMQAGRKRCDSVAMAEKFECLRNALRPCAIGRNAAQSACLATFKTCVATCEPLDKARLHFWCVADVGNSTRAGFCVGGPGKSANEQARECDKLFNLHGPPGIVSMSCETL